MTNEKLAMQGGGGRHNVFFAIRRTITRHASGGNVLIAVTVLAMIVANIPAINQYYFDFWNEPVRLQLGDFNLFAHAGEPMTMLEFINDALMVVFFFTIGLEIKREVLVGELSSIKNAMLPVIAAVGGMLLPVCIFMLIGHGSDYTHGAAIPMATDIAFSLGVLSMLGRRVPLSLKVFLTTLAVVDDIGGIIVIAACYSSHIEMTYLLYATGVLGLLYLGSVMHVQSKIYYISLGGIVWFLFLNSGIHPTIAGVLVAFCIPARPVFAPKKYIRTIRDAINRFHAEDDELLQRRSILNHEQMDWLKQVESASDKVISPLQDLEDTLHPIVNYIIIPLFAFANAGIYLLEMNPATIFEGISLAIICGLVIGKVAGIFGFSWLAIRLGIVPKPEGADWAMLASVSMLGGIGFTVSLFIASLSFTGMGAHGSDLLNHAKLGIVVGSLLSGIIGFVLLHRTLPKASDTVNDDDYDVKPARDGCRKLTEGGNHG